MRQVYDVYAYEQFKELAATFPQRIKLWHSYVGTCPQCEKPFTARSRRPIYCSPSCRQKAYRLRNNLSEVNRSEGARRANVTKRQTSIDLACHHCDEPYTADGIRAPNSKYCSNRCKTAAYRKRKSLAANEPSNWKCSTCSNVTGNRKVLSNGWKIKCANCGSLSAIG